MEATIICPGCSDLIALGSKSHGCGWTRTDAIAEMEQSAARITTPGITAEELKQQQSAEQDAMVTLDCLASSYRCKADLTDRWNGFVAAPRFEKAELMRLLSDLMDATEDPGFDHISYAFDVDGTLVSYDEAGTHIEGWDPDPDGLYAFGERSFAWIEHEDDPFTLEEALSTIRDLMDDDGLAGIGVIALTTTTNGVGHLGYALVIGNELEDQNAPASDDPYSPIPADWHIDGMTSQMIRNRSELEAWRQSIIEAEVEAAERRAGWVI